jgi:formylglycine-generating enzyme required for sulfatase activity
LGSALLSSARAQTATNSPSRSIALELGNGAKMDFVLIPAGTFIMGAEDSRADEKPATKVTFTRPFYFGKYEVTQEQWQAVMGSNPSYYKGTNLPVEQVSWNAAQGFLTNLNERVRGYRFRLPTEAEWEYACRAGTTAQYSFGDGDAALPEYGWFTGNGGRKPPPRRRDTAHTNPGTIPKRCRECHIVPMGWASSLPPDDRSHRTGPRHQHRDARRLLEPRTALDVSSATSPFGAWASASWQWRR